MAYLARLQTTSAVPPAEAVGTIYFISSPAIVSDRFCSAPLQFGNVLDSMRKMRDLLSRISQMDRLAHDLGFGFEVPFKEIVGESGAGDGWCGG